jgi:hypothetical protein
MKTLTLLLFCLLLDASVYAQISVCFTTGDDQNEEDCNHEYCSLDGAPFTFSKGLYRIPYLELTSVYCNNDHIKHCPRGAIDMNGVGDENATFYIVAAADGWIRKINDEDTESCDAGCNNNYVWIEHPNGEWTKYTHVKYHSASDLHNEDEWVVSGEIIGKEGSVGISTGPHCHFEVAVPVDTNTLIYNEGGGWINESWADNLVPLFCNIPGHVMESGETNTALSCGNTCDAIMPVVNTTYSAGRFNAEIDDDALSNSVDIIFEAASAGVMQAGTSITLTPGFHAQNLSHFEARIGECSGAGFNKNETQPANEVEFDSEFLLSPNPAADQSAISFFVLQEGEIKIFLEDINGRKLMTIADKNFKTGNFLLPINLNQLSSGIYLVRKIENGFVSTKKLVVQ